MCELIDAINEKKKIYLTWLEQSFNAFDIEESSGKWYKPNKVIEKRDTIRPSDRKHYILASTMEEAISKYKDRYKTEGFNYVIDSWYGCFMDTYPRCNKKNPQFEYKVCAEEVNLIPTFDTLKKELRADEFLEYCRQQMFPLEVVIADKN